MEKETFRVMWEMSAPGSDTEGCFLRLPQAEYYIDKRVNATGLEHMPDVSKFHMMLTAIAVLSVLMHRGTKDCDSSLEQMCPTRPCYLPHDHSP